MSNQRSFWRKACIRLAIAAVVVAVAFGIVVRFFPLQLVDFSERASLWTGGIAHELFTGGEIHQLRAGGFHAYESDHCGKKQECVCVALIHGMVDSSLRWRKTLLVSDEGWRDVGLIQQALRFYAFDLPGINGSDTPPTDAGYRVRTIAEKLHEAMAPLCPHWVVVGNSLGGWIAMWLAFEWPEDVDRLLLVDSAGYRVDPKSELAATFLDPKPQDVRGFLSRLYYHPPKLSDSVLPMIAKRFIVRHAPEIVRAQNEDDFVEPYLPKLKMPTMFLWGAEDRVIPPEEGRKMAKLVPGSVWREIPSCGHLPETECPVALDQALADLIKQPSP